MENNKIEILFANYIFGLTFQSHLIDINEVDNIKLQIGNKIEKLKLFFAEGSLKALNMFEQFLMKAFESM